MPEPTASEQLEASLSLVSYDLQHERDRVAHLLEKRDALIREAEAKGIASRYKLSQWAGISLARVGMICDLSKDGHNA